MIYVCGPTVYNRLHIGNFRPLIVAQIIGLIRKCKVITNITDVDDKILNKVIDEKCAVQYINFYTKYFKNWLKILNIKIKTASCIKNIDVMKLFLDELIKKQVVQQKQDGLYYKPAGFALWKYSKDKFWPIWYKGRPGWHLECAALVRLYNCKIHLGGTDLKFPHHHNEDLLLKEVGFEVKQWIHIKPVTIHNVKMSKSKNNILYLQDIINNVSAYNICFIRYLLLSVDYDRHMQIQEEVLTTKRKQYCKLLNLTQKLRLPLSIEYVKSGFVLRKILETNNLNLLKQADKFYKIIPLCHKFVLKNILELCNLHENYRKKQMYVQADELKHFSEKYNIALITINNRTNYKINNFDNLEQFVKVYNERYKYYE